MYRRFRTAESQKQREEDKAKKIVEDCWRIVRQQCKDHEGRKSSAETQESTWKTVRVFVSSTFTDFFCEREVLVKKVFPELRDWCEERRLHLVECDMRWGVPKDFTSEDKVIACMEELDRCHQHHQGKPFFFNMIGERYGWMPEMDELGTEIKERYQWVPNTSITFMEILHGAYRAKNPNAVFFLRDPNVVEDIPDDFRNRFLDSQPLNKGHLKELKENLKRRFPGQVFEYKCRFDRISEETGRKRVVLTGLEDFSELALSYLKMVIQDLYPASSELKEKDLENEEQENNLEMVSNFVIGRDDVLDILMSYAAGKDLPNLLIKGEESAFVRDPVFWEVQESDKRILCLTAAAGYGKTTILSQFIKEIIKSGMEVFYHFVGCSLRSQNTELMLKRLAQAVTRNTISVPDDEKDHMEYYKKKLKESFSSLRTDDKQLVIVIDAVNELEDRNSYRHLSWLPPRLPGNVRLIVSSADDHLPTIHRLKEHECYLYSIPSLGRQEAKNILTKYLGVFNKKLDSGQLEMVLSKPCSKNPLFLRLLAEQLRMFGDFRLLDQKISSLSYSIDGLIDSIINELVTNDETKKMKWVLSIICCSKGGIPETDLKNISGDVEKRESLPALYWAKIRRMVKPFIKYSGHQESISFVHTTIGQVAQKTLIDGEKERREIDTLLAEYYLNWCTDDALRMHLVPHYCQVARLSDKLVDFMRHSNCSTRIPDFNRSHILEKVRCKQLADPVIQMNMPVVICRGCSSSYFGFSAKHFPLNKDACVVCGTHVFSHQVKHAYLCHRHSLGQSKLMGKCILCNIPIRKDESGNVADFMGAVGKLCQFCSFGILGKQCSHIGS